MKEYWTVRAKVDGQGPWRISDDGFLRMDNENWGQFKKRSDAYTAMAATTRVYENLGSGAKVTFKLVHHTVKTKPRGAKVGTWAWACEHMLAGKEVTRLNYGVTVKFKMLLDRYDRWCIHTFASERWTIACVSECFMRAHDWKVVP